MASMDLAILDGRPATWTAAFLCGLALASFFVFFRTINNRLAAHAYNDQELIAVLRQWSIWHHARTVMVILAFGVLAIGR
ncbi:DUF1772 domain-containing protein [uncultured Tateyamaria sp.]|uniref:DUF1772 domain-containing protein n=1 Tax=uncultured Tateyamaria sp. TaxID=455651 RepID=UPI002618FE33|nr:DUF1772 domain-containing protein [uncultured Tateyamaria sp.]